MTDINKTIAVPRPAVPQPDLMRNAIIHVPPSYVAGKPMPLLIVLHGATGKATSIAAQTGFNALADTQGFIVIYPNGTDIDTTTGKLTADGGYWNTLSGLGDGAAEKAGVDDLGFLKLLIDYAKATYSISVVYLAGLSKGGIMGYALTRLMPGVFKAFAGVATTRQVLDPALTVPPYVPLPIMHIHGTADDVIPRLGGVGPATPKGPSWPALKDVFGALVADNVDLDFRLQKDMIHEWPAWATAPVWDFLKAHA